MLINKSMRLYSVNRVTSDQERVCWWRFIAVTLEGEKVFDRQRATVNDLLPLEHLRKAIRL